mgnify:FL=1
MKFFKISALLLLIILTINVNAAGIPYDWIVNGEEVFENSSDGTVSLVKDSTTVTLTLNNYNGGSLKLNCYGTSIEGLNFTINLIGNNTITTDDEYGIDFTSYNGKITFIGDGNLTINANSPISYENFSSNLYISPAENIYTDQHQIASTDIDGDNIQNKAKTISDKGKSKSSNSDNSLVIIMGVAFLSYILVSIAIFVILISKNKKLKTNY